MGTYRALGGNGTGRFLANNRASGPVSRAPAPNPTDKKPRNGGSTEPAGVSIEARLVGAKDAYKIDLGGLSVEDFTKEVTTPRRPGPGRPAYPASPAVGLKLELTNTGKEEIKVQVGGNANKLTLDLKGPGAVYAPIVIQNFLPIRRPPTVITIAPGKSATIADVSTLGFPKPGTGSQAYWTKAGEYTLVVDYILGVAPIPDKTEDQGEGFGLVTVHSAPLPLKVVEGK